MKKTIIIGGGIAGLSAAIHLLRGGIKPLLLESTKKPGGRATSFFDPDFNSSLDNGQHILMGCYRETLNLFSREQINKNFILQNALCISYSEGESYKLRAPHLFYPLNLALAILKYKPLSLTEALSAVYFMKRVLFNLVKNPNGKNVRDWLNEHGQIKRLITYLWTPLIIGAMNTSPEKADAELFRKIIKEIFLSGNFSSTIILPKYDLQSSLVTPLADTIISLGGELSLSSQVTKLAVLKDGYTIHLKDGREEKVETVIFAVPRHALNKIEMPEQFVYNSYDDFTYSNILSVHLKVKGINLKEEFIGLHNSPVHWVFNKGSFLSVVISDADKYKDMEEQKILDIIIPELQKNRIITDRNIISFKIIKEKRATFVPDSKSQKYRLPCKTNLSGIYLAGDWTDTGLPATIEGAALSGRVAAEAISKNIN